MSDKKHIDRIFQEKLKDLNVSPREEVWANISQELGHKKGGKKVFPIWWRLAGAAAIIVLLFALGNFIYEKKDPVQSIPVIVDSDNSETNTNDVIDNTLKDTKAKPEATTSDPEKTPQNKPQTNTNSTLAESEGKKTNKFKNTTKTLNSSTEQRNKKIVAKKQNKAEEAPTSDKIVIAETNITNTKKIKDSELKEIIDQNSVVIAEAENNKESKETISAGQKNISTDELIKEQEKEKIPLTEDVIANNEDINEEEKETINRWQVSPNIAPVYFNSLGKGSSLDGQFNNNPKTGELNTSYGVNVGYAINDKITIKTGLNSLALSYDTDNVILYENIGASPSSAASFRNLKINNAEISMISANNVNAQQVNSVIGANSKAAISQRFEYFEIPLEVDYKLVSKKMGVNLVGGFSTFFLRNNEVVSEFDGFNTYIGEATNINNISYSLNLGFGFDFPLSRKMSFNIDPKFKYQINTFKDTSGNFRPYIIGLYTGINYKF